MAEPSKSTTDKITLTIKFFESLNLLFVLITLKDLLEHNRFVVTALRYVVMPAAVLISTLSAIYAWRKATLSQHNTHAYLRAGVETLAAIGTLIAAVATVALASAFAIIGPALYGAILGARALFGAGSAIYFEYCARKAKNSRERAEYRANAINEGIDAAIGSVVSASIICMSVFAGPIVQMAGYVLGLIAVTAAIVSIFIRPSEATMALFETETVPKDDQEEASQNYENTSTARLQSALDVKATGTGIPVQPVKENVRSGPVESSEDSYIADESQSDKVPAALANRF